MNVFPVPWNFTIQWKRVSYFLLYTWRIETYVWHKYSKLVVGHNKENQFVLLECKRFKRFLKKSRLITDTRTCNKGFLNIYTEPKIGTCINYKNTYITITRELVCVHWLTVNNASKGKTKEKIPKLCISKKKKIYFWQKQNILYTEVAKFLSRTD